MPIKARTILLKLNEQVKQLSQPVATTFSPSTGTIPPATQYEAPVSPSPVVGKLQAPGDNFTTG